MKKQKLFIILFLVLMLPIVVKANCDSENNCDCAYCVYEIGNVNACHMTFSVTYKDNGLPLDFEIISQQDAFSNGKCYYNYSNNFTQNSFKVGDTLKCPNLNQTSEIDQKGSRNFDMYYTVTPDNNGSISPQSNSAVKKGSGNNSSNKSDPLVFRYDTGACGGFTIYVIDNEVRINLDNSGYKYISRLDASLFKASNPPKVYTYYEGRELKSCIFDTTYIAGYYTSSPKLQNQNTGETVSTPSQVGGTGSGGIAGEQRLDYNSWCSSGTEGNIGIRKAARIIGYVIAIAKWIVPMILIIFGIVDFTKASISSDDKALSKATSSLLKRLVAGIIVVFIPTIAIAILNFIEVSKGITDESNPNFAACTKCIFNPKSCN